MGEWTKRYRVTSTASTPRTVPCSIRIHRLILVAHPDAAMVLSYQIPTYKVGRRRLYVGAWRHGISIYGWAGP